MTKSIYLSLPVQDVAAATRFYAAIGCEKNPQFSDETTSCMTWSETITFMLIGREAYATFTAKPIADARQTSACGGHTSRSTSHVVHSSRSPLRL